jgi:HD-GYP domain-containing protein (c-di-GMP phosphodiesterase class II)
LIAGGSYSDLIRYLVAAVNGRKIYPIGHPVIERTLSRVEGALQELLVRRDAVQLGVLGTRLLADGLPWEEQGDSLTAFSQELKNRGIDKLTFERGCSRTDLEGLLEVLCGDKASGQRGSGGVISVQHLLAGRGVNRIRVAQLDLERRRSVPPGAERDQGVYQDAVEGLGEAMESARTGKPSRIKRIRGLVELLIQHMQRDPGPLLMLTAMKSHSEYTFTHIVNVTILSLAQVQAITSDQEVIREYGIAAMLHDMGKMRIPKEILDKKEKLSDEEIAAIRRHPLDTVLILRDCRGISDLPVIVGFEHHRRFDGTGYPPVRRPLPQHFASRLVTIADAYDAMRSNRSYQREMPADQAMATLQREAGKMFDPVLVRLFIRMMGAYPPGTRVRLDAGEEAMVLRANPDDPFRPIVRLLSGDSGAGESLRLVNLVDLDPKRGVFLRSIAEPLLDSPPAD